MRGIPPNYDNIMAGGPDKLWMLRKLLEKLNLKIRNVSILMLFDYSRRRKRR